MEGFDYYRGCALSSRMRESQLLRLAEEKRLLVGLKTQITSNLRDSFPVQRETQGKYDTVEQRQTGVR